MGAFEAGVEDGMEKVAISKEVAERAWRKRRETENRAFSQMFDLELPSARETRFKGLARNDPDLHRRRYAKNLLRKLEWEREASREELRDLVGKRRKFEGTYFSWLKDKENREKAQAALQKPNLQTFDGKPFVEAAPSRGGPTLLHLGLAGAGLAGAGLLARHAMKKRREKGEGHDKQANMLARLRRKKMEEQGRPDGPTTMKVVGTDETRQGIRG